MSPGRKAERKPDGPLQIVMSFSFKVTWELMREGAAISVGFWMRWADYDIKRAHIKLPSNLLFEPFGFGTETISHRELYGIRLPKMVDKSSSLVFI